MNSSPFALAGKKGLVFGVANKRSIAWGIAAALREAGAELGLTYQVERLRANVEALAGQAGASFLLPCDVTDDAQVEAVFAAAQRAWGGLDFLVHSIAFARVEDLDGGFLGTSREGFLAAHEISAFSLTRLCQAAGPLFNEGAAVLTLSYIGGERVVPGYNIMGVAKASLEASVRYLASELGPRGIRVNAISAGPMKTLAASSLPGLTVLRQHVQERAPLRKNVSLEEIGNAARFLLSPAASGVTGEVLHVDGGLHAVVF